MLLLEIMSRICMCFCADLCAGVCCNDLYAGVCIYSVMS